MLGWRWGGNSCNISHYYYYYIKYDNIITILAIYRIYFFCLLVGERGVNEGVLVGWLNDHNTRVWLFHFCCRLFFGLFFQKKNRIDSRIHYYSIYVIVFHWFRFIYNIKSKKKISRIIPWTQENYYVQKKKNTATDLILFLDYSRLSTERKTTTTTNIHLL